MAKKQTPLAQVAAEVAEIKALLKLSPAQIPAKVREKLDNIEKLASATTPPKDE